MQAWAVSRISVCKSVVTPYDADSFAPRRVSFSFLTANQSHHGFSQKETENQDQQAQATQAHAGQPPQEAFALQVLKP